MEVNKNQETMMGELRNELNCSELVIESNVVFEENYQLQMIQENDLARLLKVHAFEKDNYGQYIYDVTGKLPLDKAFEKKTWDKKLIKKFLKQLMEVIKEGNNYLLNIHCIVLDPRYIFTEGEEFYFCYYPLVDQILSESFHRLTEYWVKNIDYNDYASVAFSCGIHKETMAESYNLDTLIGKYASVLEEEKEPQVEEIMKDAKNWNAMDEREVLQTRNDLWEEEEKKDSYQKFKDKIMESSIGKYLEQKKKEKWGEWDDLISQEESSIMDKRLKIK